MNTKSLILLTFLASWALAPAVAAAANQSPAKASATLYAGPAGGRAKASHASAASPQQERIYVFKPKPSDRKTKAAPGQTSDTA